MDCSALRTVTTIPLFLLSLLASSRALKSPAWYRAPSDQVTMARSGAISLIPRLISKSRIANTAQVFSRRSAFLQVDLR
jgi:hypothetical protein